MCTYLIDQKKIVSFYLKKDLKKKSFKWTACCVLEACKKYWVNISNQTTLLRCILKFLPLRIGSLKLLKVYFYSILSHLEEWGRQRWRQTGGNLVKGSEVSEVAQLSPTLCDPRLRCPWDFPGKNTGVSRHLLLQWKEEWALKKQKY